VDDIYVPDEAIAMTGIRARELGEMTGISFQESFDDLDVGYFAVLVFNAGFNVALKDYPRAPVKGVTIRTDPEGQCSRRRLQDILSGLNLSAGQLTWVRPDLE